MKKHKDLLTAPVGRTLLELAAPMVFGMAAVILFTVVDTFYVGRLGTEPLAAMGFTFPVVYFVMAIAMGMGVGVTAVISRIIGEGDYARVRRITTDGLILANTLVVIFAVAGFFTIGPLFSAMGATPELIVLIRDYMAPWYFGIGFLVIPMVGNSAIRATGDTKTPSVIMVIAGGLNIVLDPFLIFGIGPFPRMELQGAAVATVISWMTTFAAALWILARREHMLDFTRPRLSDMLSSWRQILFISIPAASTNVMVPLAGGILTRMASMHGPEAVAAYGVGTRIEALSLIGTHSLYAAITPFVGQNFGAGNCARLRTALRFAIKACIVYGIAIAALLAVFAAPLAAVFNADPTVQNLIMKYVFIIPISYGLYTSSLQVNGLFNGVNKPMSSAYIIILRLFVLAVPLAYFGSRAAGIPGLYAGISTANVVVGITAIVMARRFLTITERDLAREALSPA